MVLVCLTAGVAWSAENEELVSVVSIWRETLRYGIDTQVLETLADIVKAEDTSLNPELTALLEISLNPRIRTAVLDYYSDLETADGEKAALSVVEFYEDNDQALVSAAIRYLGILDSVPAFEPLSRVAQTAGPILAASAVRSIGLIGPGEAQQFLLELYDDDDMGDEVKNQIVLALGKTGGSDAVDLLLELVLDRDADRIRRMYGCTALGDIGDDRAVDALRQVFGEKDALLRTYAAAALGRFPEADVLPLLLQGLRDSNWKVRIEAARGVAAGSYKAGDHEELVPMLRYKVEQDPVKNVRKEAMRALAGIGTREAMSILRGIYEKDGEAIDVREAALKQLIEHDLSNSVDSIKIVIDQEWERSPQRTLEMTSAHLSRADGGFLGPVYEQMLSSANVAVRIGAMRGIARNGLSALADRIRRIADSDPYAAAKREALSALEKLGLPYEPEESE